MLYNDLKTFVLSDFLLESCATLNDYYRKFF